MRFDYVLFPLPICYNSQRLAAGLFSLLLLFSLSLQGQDLQLGRISGSFQSDVQLLFPDSIIGADAVDEKVLSNSYLQLVYQKGNFSAGVRYEAYLNPLLGFDQRYQGQGISYRYADYVSDKLDLTVGNFYEQFGNGIIFRAYQEWALGIDNSIDGIRIRVRPRKGITLKGMIGKQRKFWEKTNSIMRGGDVEFYFNDMFGGMKEAKTRITLGGSVMSKFEEDQDSRLQLPENVTAFSGRTRISRGGFNIDAEYAYKINDPFQLNKYVYNPGSALYLNAVYSTKGFGATASFKRIDNMDFRSERTVTLQELSLSFLPAISRLHTYRLPTLYPYATQLNGEVGFQGTLIYTIPRKSKLGGKYGTQIYLNYSRIHGLDTTFVEPEFRYETSWMGDPEFLYFQDINLEINRKWTPKLRTVLTYIYLRYNKDIVELGTPNGGAGIVDAHSGIVEVQYKIKRKVSLRGEIQHMYTQQDLGSWVMGLLELSISPHWYFTVFDEYNYGNSDPIRRVHYYNFSAAYVYQAQRFALTYSRQRRGLLCVGGICREVPASNGFSLSITSTF